MEPIKSQAIIPRIDGIQNDLQKLNLLAKLSPDEFAIEDNFVKAQFYLRRALEGVFHIGSHILSRIPGGRATGYKEIAIKLGEFNIVEKTFANGNLKKMAGYRNRLTHYYSNITPEEIHKIIKESVADFDIFLHSVKNLLQHPEKFNLKVE
jgi:uncharacterized protein YutE (UPF0331/DUF86 family)